MNKDCKMNKISLSRSLALVVLFMVFVFVGCNNSVEQQGDNGRFSVSATKQVVFAPGNLAEDGRSFVAHQWEYGWLFGWGTGDRPADTTDDWQKYIRFVDWGKYVEGGWRTLTADEWHFLLFERTDAGNKWAKGTVIDMHGLLLLPDKWELPSGCTFTAGNNGWDVNGYTTDQWEQMEAAGAVFLPAEGFRWGEMSYGFNCEGLYWSSTTKDKGCPFTMHFDDNILAVDWDDEPQFGQSVRLVRDCR